MSHRVFGKHWYFKALIKEENTGLSVLRLCQVFGHGIWKIIRNLMQYTISARGKAAAIPIQRFIKENYDHIPLEQIDSFFGFTEFSTLYGGRFFTNTEISRYDIRSLYGMNINVRLPITNHYATPEEYEESQPFLEKYHRPGNSLIITNDELAKWIRNDFPDYRLEASVIKNIHTL
jgi:hypothetical protein